MSDKVAEKFQRLRDAVDGVEQHQDGPWTLGDVLDRADAFVVQGKAAKDEYDFCGDDDYRDADMMLALAQLLTALRVESLSELSEALAALTAAAEREKALREEVEYNKTGWLNAGGMINRAQAQVEALREENARLTAAHTEAQTIASWCVEAAREELDGEESEFALSFPAVRCVADVVTSFKQEVERLNGELDKLAITLSHEAHARAAERQKVQALREWLSKPRAAKGPYTEAEVLDRMDALGLPSDPPRADQ